MANLRGGMKVGDKPLTAAMVDDIAEGTKELDDPNRFVVTIADRATLVVAAGLEGQLDIDDLSRFEMEALASARRAQRAEDHTILAVCIEAARRTENLATLVPKGLSRETDLERLYAILEAKGREAMGVADG